MIIKTTQTCVILIYFLVLNYNIYNLKYIITFIMT